MFFLEQGSRTNLSSSKFVALFAGLALMSFAPCANAVVRVEATAEEIQIASSDHWLRLIHYRKTRAGFKSELDGEEFFFSSEGKTQPLAELLASKRAMGEAREVGRLKLHPQCAFPERYRFLREKFPNDMAAAIACPKFDEFLERYRGPKAVSVVFSTAYPNNPASMFGHTFLKFESERKSDLLDYGVNYAAKVPPDENPFAFMYFGVMGGYFGQWSMEPYFTKVNEYVNSESRDLWEYELNLTPEETLRLLAHLWELEVTSHFDYYFFDENCSYQVLKAIEAIRTDWSISQHKIYVIPGETIKSLFAQPNAVRSVRHRPSLYTQVLNSYESLNRDRQSLFRRLAFAGPAPEDLAQASAQDLDLALLYMKYLRFKKKGKLKSKETERENLLLAARTQKVNEVQPPKELPLPETRPELGHDPFLLGFSLGSLQRGDGEEEVMGGVRLRSAYHDLMNNDRGYSPFSEIEFPWLEVRFTEEDFWIHQLGFLNSTSLFPLSALNWTPSWRIKATLDQNLLPDCERCLMPRVEVGGGMVWGRNSARAYLFGLLREEFHRRLHLGHRTRPGVEVAALWQVTPEWKMRFQGQVFATVWPLSDQDHEFDRIWDLKWDHAWALSRNHELRQVSQWTYLDAFRYRGQVDLRLEYNYYFR